LALRIWAAQFLFLKYPWRLDRRAGPGDALEMIAITPGGSASAGTTPLPIRLNQQLDSFVEGKTAELEHQFLTMLQTRIFLKRPPDEWFGIYLAVFVFFTALEEDTWNLAIWNGRVKSTEITVSSFTLAAAYSIDRILAHGASYRMAPKRAPRSPY